MEDVAILSGARRTARLASGYVSKVAIATFASQNLVQKE
jgi:hypothetical protein